MKILKSYSVLEYWQATAEKRKYILHISYVKFLAVLCLNNIFYTHITWWIISGEFRMKEIMQRLKLNNTINTLETGICKCGGGLSNIHFNLCKFHSHPFSERLSPSGREAKPLEERIDKLLQDLNLKACLSKMIWQ